MIDPLKYKKRIDKAIDEDFNKKIKYGKIYYYASHIFMKDGLSWTYFPLSQVKTIEILAGSRQLRQCCGAPIYPTQELLITTKDDEHLYIRVEEDENGIMNKAQKLMEQIIIHNPNIVWIKNSGCN